MYEYDYHIVDYQKRKEKKDYDIVKKEDLLYDHTTRKNEKDRFK